MKDKDWWKLSGAEKIAYEDKKNKRANILFYSLLFLFVCYMFSQMPSP